MTDTVIRVAVHAPRQQLSADLALPTACPVALLLPSIVDNVLGHGEPARWILAAAAGLPLESAKSLRDNAVRDGDLLVLTDEPIPPPRVCSSEPTGAVIDAGREAGSRVAAAVAAFSVSALLALAASLGWAGSVTGQGAALWVSAGISVAAAVTAAAGWVAPPLTEALCIGAVGHAAVTGALAGGSSWAMTTASAGAAALAMAVCLSMSLRRWTIAATSTLTGCAAAACAVTLAAAIGVLASARVGAAGALLTAVSLGALGAAATVTVAMAGIGPARRSVGPRRAQTAHRLLTGMVAGWSGTATAGVALVAADPRASRAAAAGFAAVVGAVLILRQRVHADPVRRIVFSAAGVVALMTALVTVVTADPEAAPWWCCGIAAVGAALLPGHLRGHHPNPLAQQVVRVLEYVAIAAVVPLGAWAAGVYEAAGAVSLP
ncbi:MAG: type VII secretion integral membrane protein EccD [Actinomycetota bacterium]